MDEHEVPGHDRAPDRGRDRSPDRGRSLDRGRDPDPAPTGVAGILRGLVDRCVRFQLVSGAQVTGMIRGVDAGAVRITIGGRTAWVVIDKIDRFQLTSC